MSLALRLALRDLRGALSGFWVLVLCLALGVGAISAVGTLRDGIRAGLAREGAALLGGDAEVTLTYRRATEDERTWLARHASPVSEVATFRSMAVTGEGEGARRALTEVKAVDEAWPIVGTAQLEPAMPLAQALEGQGGLPGVVMDPLLIARLGLTLGDQVALGGHNFVLMAALAAEPDAAAAGFGLGPRSLVRLAELDGTDLLREGTLFDAHYRLALPGDTDLEALKASALAAIDGARWRDARDGAPGLRRLVDRLAAFLVLVGLAGLAVGGVGVSAAVGAWIGRRHEQIAVLRTLGAETGLVFRLHLAQVLLLAGLGIVAGLALGGVLPVLARSWIAAQLPVPLELSLRFGPLAQAAVVGALAALLFALWPLARLEAVRPAALFRGTGESRRTLPRPRYWVSMALLLALLLGAAAGLSGNLRLALWAAGGLLAGFGVLVAAGAVLARVARRLARSPAVRGRPALRWALAAMGAPASPLPSVVLALGLGLSVLAAIGQIDANLRGAIARQLPQAAPSFFVLDILPDQIDAFRAQVRAEPGVTRLETAPMLRGVITRINGRPASEVTDHWVVRGDRGLTYAATPPARTRLVAGKWWAEDEAGPPQVSFAAEEAAEIGLKLGDTLTVNVLGRDITATITSLREVDFSSAGMGFVMVMNPSAVAGAPHSYIATIYAETAAEPGVMARLGSQFSNITIISVRDVIGRVAGLMGSISAGLMAAALVTLLTGFAVLVGTAGAGQPARSREAALLKTLGATRARIALSLGLRVMLMGAAAGAIALGLGAAFAWAVLAFVMDTGFAFAPLNAALVVGGGIVITLAANLAFSLGALNARPARVLRARE